ncbi:MAG: NAD(P)-dependent oxidoreductase [Acidiphilium sp.]|nr:NAD(P)-dependent oxidoreductase [Acidiphilium sp.]MDD4936639.1 NAD(P)-dependent oxidoreductase [Acidiphilium sp.]
MSTIISPDICPAMPDVAAARLPPALLIANFADVHPPLSLDQSAIEAARCYFCHDAPCVAACPTAIDIPGFIRAIASGNLAGAGQRILSANILGGTCARVCPTDSLCQGACVRRTQQNQPVAIGALQRVATDHVLARAQATGSHPFTRAAPSGRRIAVVGAGPAGLACAHTLSRAGHEVTIFDAKPKPGGLNEYGIAAYKMADDFAAREVAFILGIGGITLHPGQTLGDDLDLASLRDEFDAVFLAIGQAGVNALTIPGETRANVLNAVDFIADLRQAELSRVAIGRRVVVIGGGNTAIDAATQALRLGADLVTIAYRRGRTEMSATGDEQTWALTNGVALRLWSAPVAIEGDEAVRAVRFARTRLDTDGQLKLTGEHFTLEADMVLKAVGQTLAKHPPQMDACPLPQIVGGRIAVDPLTRETSVPGIFAGGDCIAGADLTVQAVEDGKRAAAGIIGFLAAGATPHG